MPRPFTWVWALCSNSGVSTLKRVCSHFNVERIIVVGHHVLSPSGNIDKERQTALGIRLSPHLSNPSYPSLDFNYM